jgi:integrase
MNFLKKPNRTGDKIYFYYDLGRAKGQRPSTGIFIFTKPKNQIEKDYNREALNLLEVKKSQYILEHQSSGTGYIPLHKFKRNFLDYYQQYVNENRRNGNRHLENSLTQFRKFLKKDFITPIDITENLCARFRQYLLDRYAGDTPANYYARFKRVLRVATKEGYFRTSPAEDIKAKSNPNPQLKEHLEAHEYAQLLRTPCLHKDLQEAFILSCYTGLRWIDVKLLDWKHINGDMLTTKIIQKKTGKPVVITLHGIARAILDNRREKAAVAKGPVFSLLTNNGCNRALQSWIASAGIKKHITWHCARLSFSILLQDENVDKATVALLLGHTSTKYVDTTYKRHRPKDFTASINKLPAPETPLFLLNSESNCG